MKQHPILFSSKMVQAILDGRKSQTRRIVKQDPQGKIPFTDELPCPYGNTGDTLWVRESWQAINGSGQWWHEVKREDRSLCNWAFTNPVEPAFGLTPPRWLPSIHMPRGVCRIELVITQLRIERLHNMSLADMEREGVDEKDDNRHPLSPFIDLWNSLNSDHGYSWESNPFVFVISFARK